MLPKVGYQYAHHRIRFMRELLRWSVADCAAAVGISERRWETWETRKAPDSIYDWMALERLFCLSMWWIVTGREHWLAPAA